METKNIGVRIYGDRASSEPGSRERAIFVLGLGVALSAVYVHSIPGDIAHYAATFPASYKSFPFLTIILSVFVLCAYAVGGCLFAAMVYIPVRNLFLPGRISGRLQSVVQRDTDKGGVILEIRLGTDAFYVHDTRLQLRHQHLQVRDLDNLRAALSDEALQGCDVRLTVGAFNRVLSVDRM